MVMCLTNKLPNTAQLFSVKCALSLFNFLLCKCMLCLCQVLPALSKRFNLPTVGRCQCDVNWSVVVTRKYMCCSTQIRTRGFNNLYVIMVLHPHKGYLEWCVWLVLSGFFSFSFLSFEQLTKISLHSISLPFQWYLRNLVTFFCHLLFRCILVAVSLARGEDRDVLQAGPGVFCLWMGVDFPLHWPTTDGCCSKVC